MKIHIQNDSNKSISWRYYFPDFRDPSTLVLTISNLVAIILAITQNWNFLTVLWVFWFQSVIIGLFFYIKLLTLKNFTTEGMTVENNGVPVDLSFLSNKKSKFMIANFFALHFGLFHLIYLVFLLFFTNAGGFSMEVEHRADFKFVFIGAIIFFINHLFSYLYNRKNTRPVKENVGYLMVFSYARIIPMQLTIVLGLPMPLFLLLKSVVDIVMHTIEHKKIKI